MSALVHFSFLLQRHQAADLYAPMIPIAASPGTTAYDHETVASQEAERRLIDNAPAALKTHADAHQLQHSARLTDGRRSVSCIEFGAAKRRFRTIRIGEDSSELCQLAEANVTQLVEIAASTATADSNNALLARKALRYRKLWTNPDNC